MSYPQNYRANVLPHVVLNSPLNRNIDENSDETSLPWEPITRKHSYTHVRKSRLIPDSESTLVPKPIEASVQRADIVFKDIYRAVPIDPTKNRFHIIYLEKYNIQR